MKRQLRSLSVLLAAFLLAYSMFVNNAFGLSSAEIPKVLEKDYKIALKQTQESETEFWDIQLKALSSEEARNVQGQYRLIDGIQWDETQFIAVKALEDYLRKIDTQFQMKVFFPEVHSKLEEVTKIWIERRSGLRPKGVDADYLPGDLRNQYPEVVTEATSRKSTKFKLIILEVSKKLSPNKTFKSLDFQVSFEFFFNLAAIQSLVETPALTPLEQQIGRIALQDEKLAKSVLKKYTTKSAQQFNKKVGKRYLSIYPSFKQFQEHQLKLYQSYLQQ
jgi:hypothetical protein